MVLSGVLANVNPDTAPVDRTQRRYEVLRRLAVVGELRAALAQTALERQRGLAALERARGESAALRSLANSAKLLRDNPELARLRLVQAASEAGGTIVLSPVDAPR